MTLVAPLLSEFPLTSAVSETKARGQSYLGDRSRSLLAYFSYFPREQIAPARRGQPSLAVIAATGEKVEMLISVVALEACGQCSQAFRWCCEDQRQNLMAFRFGNPPFVQTAKGGPHATAESDYYLCQVNNHR
jgi:hypothetical protein